MKNLFILLLIFSVFSCTPTSKVNEVDIEMEMEAIMNNISAFSQHVMNGDAEAIADAYTSDGKIFPNNRDIMEGRDALVKYWSPQKGYKTTYHKVKPEEIKILGDEAYDYGYYEGKTLNESTGKESSWKGKYVIVWKKVKGEWKIYLDIWNRIAT